MEIILGVFISGVLEIIKALSKKFGKELAKKIVLLVLFILVFTFTYMQSAGMIPKEFITSMISMLTTAVATYQLITKPLLAKLLINDDEENE